MLQTTEVIVMTRKKIIPPELFELTEIYTWFERDRAYVDLRFKDSNETIVKWWDEDVELAVEDGFLKPGDWHTTALEYALNCNLMPLAG